MTNRSYPGIRIKDAWLLRQNASAHLHKLWDKKDRPLADNEHMKKKVAAYKKAWNPYEKEIIHGMCDLLELEFRQNIIDVNIAPWFGAFSDPMVIGVIYEPNRFVEVLTHELLHRLLSDNIQTDYGTDYPKQWKKLFGEEHSFKTLVHIPVHATLQAVFDDVLHEPERTKHDKKLCEQWPDYHAAWQYVGENGYKEIIDQLKNSYKSWSHSTKHKK